MVTVEVKEMLKGLDKLKTRWRDWRMQLNRQDSTLSDRSVASIGDRLLRCSTALKGSTSSLKTTSTKTIVESRKKFSKGLSYIRSLSEDAYWLGEDGCISRAMDITNNHELSNSGPDLPYIKVLNPERNKEQSGDGAMKITIEKQSGDLHQFVQLVYKRLKVYRGIYLFYSIISFMLGLPVMVTGFHKQLSSSNTNPEFLECPHYLGIVALLSCFISLWCALRGQIVNCVLTLLFGFVTVVASLVVLVVTAVALSKELETGLSDDAAREQDHLQQQTHVIFISSMILFLASLALVATALSHLSNRKVKIVTRGDERIEKPALPTIEESAEEINLPLQELDRSRHRYSFATTISTLIKHELKDRKCEGKETLKKTVSCPTEGSSKNSKHKDLLETILSDTEQSTQSLPTSAAEFSNQASTNIIIAKWKRLASPSFSNRVNDGGDSLQTNSSLVNEDKVTQYPHHDSDLIVHDPVPCMSNSVVVKHESVV